jgi:hypothetical protein
MTYEGITVSDIAKATGLKRHTIEVRIHRLGIKPLSYEARYPSDTLEKVKAVKMGRPKKTTSAKPLKKPKN